MIRAVVFWAAVVCAPLAVVAQVEVARPAGPVADAYYLKRQERRNNADTTREPVSQDNLQDAATEPDIKTTTTSAAVPVVTATTPAAPAAKISDPYYAQRHAAIARVPLTAQATQYANSFEAAETVQAPEEITSQTSESMNVGSDGEYTDDCGDELSMSSDGRFMAAVYSVPTTNVLWNELYSCRSMWVNLDYLGFWVKGNHVPPLVTTSPIGTPQADAGVLGLPTTSILFGDQRLNTDLRSGGRVTIGGWIVGDVLGVEGNYYALGTARTEFSAASTFSQGPSSDIILARPFFNPAPPILAPPPPHPQLPPAQSRDLIAYPGNPALDGSVRVTESSSIQSAGIMFRRLLGIDLVKDHRLFLLAGYRFFRLEEGLEITDQNTIVGAGIPAGSGFTHFDSFGTKNLFNGGDFGLLSDFRYRRWILETQAKVALGDMYEVVDIDGQTKVNNGATIAGYPGGVLTQGSNIGVYRHNQFAVIPELNIKLGFQITPGLRATVGYNFTYVSRVARPGNEVDMVVNPPYTAGAAQIVARPMYLSNPTDLWLQGFTVGGEYHW